jgi:hypothetical protein
MNNLSLSVKQRTPNGSVHLEVKSSNNELGILYLSEEEYLKLVQILRVGCFNKEVDFSVDDRYTNADEVDEEQSHIFFSID